MKNDKQLYFDFYAETKKKKRKPPVVIDYRELALWIGMREVTLQELQEHTGVTGGSIFHIIDTLSINYTLYDTSPGHYRMITDPRKKEG